VNYNNDSTARPMSNTSSPDALADVATGRDADGKREVLNPFDGPATLLDAANELCRGYMAAERDSYHLLGDHHSEWLRLLDQERKCILNCHRDGLKTTTVLCYLVLRLEYDSGFQAIWAMNNQEMAVEKADGEFNKFVERNPWLTSLQPDTRDRNTAKKKAFENGSSLRATYLDGGIDGERAHLLVLDDLIKARGDGDPESVREWIEGTATPMVKDGGRTIFVGTRKRRGDIYQHYRSLPAYSVAEYPAMLDVWEREHAADGDYAARKPPEKYYTDVEYDGETHRILWPDARGPDWLAGKRDEMADYRFYREYCLSLIGGSGDLIASTDVNQPVDAGGCSIRGEMPPREYTAAQGETIIVAYDPAQSPTGDNQAFVALLFGRDGCRTLLDASIHTGLSPSQIKAELQALDRRYDPAQIAIESNGMQSYIENDAIEFSAELRGKVTGIATTGTKHSWENGIPQLRNLVESGSFQFYRGHGGTEDFITAAESLELRDGKLHGHTPDMISAWHIAEQAQRDLTASDEESFLITQ
jgi:hypothetical protein